MYYFPKLRQLHSSSSLECYSKLYEQSSGLPIPKGYLFNTKNQVFGIVHNQQLVGGFILGTCTSLRTVAVFAAAEDQEHVDRMAGQAEDRTEITCFWIDAAARKDIIVNRYTWGAMIYAIARYAKSTLVFGTCSRGLARLYATSQHAELLHQDRLNNKPVFIFKGLKRHAILGIGNILAYKSSWKWNPLRLFRKQGSIGLSAMVKELKLASSQLTKHQRA